LADLRLRESTCDLQLQPADYTVEVSAKGFAKQKRENVTLQVNTPATMNFTMQVSATKVEIEVTSEAPLVNTQDTSIGNAFNTRQLIDLPSEGRDPVAILSLQPGVTYIGSQVDQTDDSRGGSVAGARSDQTNIMGRRARGKSLPSAPCLRTCLDVCCDAALFSSMTSGHRLRQSHPNQELSSPFLAKIDCKHGSYEMRRRTHLQVCVRQADENWNSVAGRSNVRTNHGGG